MIATTRLGSFIVNLGHLAKIPRGEERVFRIAGTPIAVFHATDGNVLATEPARPHKAYPATVNEEGEILVGIEEVLAAR
jgi:hypothetical protein